MAYTPANYTGDGSTTDFAFSFPYIDYEDVKVLLDDVETFAFTIVSESTVRFTVAPTNGVDIKIYRDTPIEVAEATFYSGSAIRAVDLNENFNQSRYYGEETRELVADATIGTIPDGSIGTAKLADGAITAAKLADDSVTAAKLADDSVSAAAIQDSAVTAVTIATGAVTNTKIADNAVTNAKLADLAVNTAELASSAVSTAKIADNAVTTAKIADDAVTNAKLADSAVNTAELASFAVSTAKIADDAVTTAKLDSTGIAPTVTAINGGPLAGFRNAIINGNFDVWQRGTSFSSPASGTYTADRWYMFFNGTGATRAITRELFTLGQTDVPGEPTYFLKWNETNAGTGATFKDLRQKIEGVRTFAGQQVTVSFYAKASSATTTGVVGLIQNFGTGGGGSSMVVTILTSPVSLTTSWQKFSFTATLPSIAGKTFGSDGNDNLEFYWRLPAATTFNIDIAQVQVEAGPVATPFERRPIGTELLLCKRYYQDYSSDATNVLFWSGYSSGTGAFGQSHRTFEVEMRAVPSITQFFISRLAFPNGDATISDVTTKGIIAYKANNASNSGAFWKNGYTADAEF